MHWTKCDVVLKRKKCDKGSHFFSYVKKKNPTKIYLLKSFSFYNCITSNVCHGTK